MTPEAERELYEVGRARGILFDPPGGPDPDGAVEMAVRCARARARALDETAVAQDLGRIASEGEAALGAPPIADEGG